MEDWPHETVHSPVQVSPELIGGLGEATKKKIVLNINISANQNRRNHPQRHSTTTEQPCYIATQFINIVKIYKLETGGIRDA